MKSLQKVAPSNKRFTLCVVTALIVLSITVRSQTNSSLHPDASRFLSGSLDSCMNTLADSGFSGVALVARGDSILLHRSYGRKGLPVDTSLAFYFSSNTELFTAAAILLLQEQGQLSVRDKISRFIPDVPADKQKITIYQLLTHTSGIGENYIAEGIPDRDDMATTVLAHPLEKPVGKGYMHTSDGYSLLAAIIELASGWTYERIVQKYLLDPARMYSTGFWGTESEAPFGIAHPRDSIKTTQRYRKIFYNGKPFSNWGMRGGNGLFGTGRDLLRWLSTLKNKKIVTDTSRALLWNPHVLMSKDPLADVYAGYGWNISTTNDGKFVEASHAGREDWIQNSIIRVFANGDVIITWAYDFGPNSNPMSVAAAKALAGILKHQP
ncbi:MAG: serine hydrolase domain-containing protein [Bacteroidota bacterium]